MRRMGTLPLMDQPGEQWRYNTGSQILGVLVARASGQTVDSFYQERIFEPLGMKDTTFHVPASDLQRLVPCYQQVDGRLEPFDDGNQWTRPRAFTDCGAGLVATAGDYLAFGQMLLAGGVHNGARFLASELVAAMTGNRLGTFRTALLNQLDDEIGDMVAALGILSANIDNSHDFGGDVLKIIDGHLHGR